MSEEARRRLETLRDRTGADSLAEVIRHALSVYDFLWTEREKGCRIAVVDPGASVGPHGREVVLIS